MEPTPGAASFLAGGESTARPRQPSGAARRGLAVLIVGLVLGSAWFTASRTFGLGDDAEIAVLVSRNNTTTWPRLVLSFTGAAQRHGWVVSEVASENPGRLRIVFPDGKAVLFRLYKELGHAGLRDRVVSLCERRRPPLAIMSGSNSGSARVVAEALHDREASSRAAPVYLISSGTVDDLTSILPGKTFRFGHKNSRQANEVVQRLLRHHTERGVDPPDVRVAVVKIEDDPFACEFTRFVKEELACVFGDARIKLNTLAVPTAIGASESPTEREREHARWLAKEMTMAPFQTWVIVVPGPAEFVRRFWSTQYEALQEAGANELPRVFDNLTYLVGDSLDFVDFNGAIPPSALHSTAIFYAQYDPRTSGGAAPDPTRVREALYHEIAETLLTVLANPSARGAPEQLRAALADFRAKPEDPTYFDGPERRGGGGAVAVSVFPFESKFLFDFPPTMK